MYRCVLRGANISNSSFKGANVLKVSWPNLADLKELREQGVVNPVVDF